MSALNVRVRLPGMSPKKQEKEQQKNNIQRIQSKEETIKMKKGEINK